MVLIFILTLAQHCPPISTKALVFDKPPPSVLLVAEDQSYSMPVVLGSSFRVAPE